MNKVFLVTPSPTHVAEGTRVQGNLVFHSQSQVFGIVEGELIQQSQEPVQIGKSGWIHGSISSQGPVIIEGRVEGDVRSETQIRVLRTAEIRGVLSCPKIEVEAGAQVEGEFTMQGDKIQTLHLLPRAA